MLEDLDLDDHGICKTEAYVFIYKQREVGVWEGDRMLTAPWLIPG